MSRRFGIEIEVVGITCSEVAQLLESNGIRCANAGYNHRTMQTWKVVTDASVARGCEIVSPPLSGAEGIEEVRKVVELVNEYGADVNKSCGIHVHIDCNDLSAQHIANIFNRYRHNEAQIDAVMPASRRGNSNMYCKSIRDLAQLRPLRTARDTARQVHDRYYKVNLTSFAKYGTIEFRQHSGSLNRAKIANWIKFLIQFVEASAPSVAPRETVTTSTASRGLRGKSKAIVDLLANGSATAQEIAETIGTTVASVQSIVCRLRRRGYHISTGRRYRLLAASAQPQVTETAAPVQTNTSLWHGIDANIKAYYERRARFLAA